MTSPHPTAGRPPVADTPSPLAGPAPRWAVDYSDADLDALLARDDTLAVFGFGRDAPRHDDPRYLRVSLQPHGAAPLEVWRVAGPVARGREGDVAWAEDGTLQFGAIELDDEYKIAKRQLQGDNKVVMEKLILGERVDTPGAQNLPLDLAIAILQDSDGRIDLGLPVSGSLDDPQFSYGQIVWKAIVNVLTKIVTAPFRALGELFGSGEQFDSIAFEVGSRKLTPPEHEKLVRLAGALNKRPGPRRRRPGRRFPVGFHCPRNMPTTSRRSWRIGRTSARTCSAKQKARTWRSGPFV